ncbi:ATP-binding protein [Azospirillum doebereinerae]|uniref:ATP-binding protein n=1 Tax=Azospirillum doebereinerae TaxID=92933 RepID=UPI001EE5F8E2|nr:ATP-binding protein [Azospirillum doebereinerae]MCG5241361.1 ATP-binding protein [Azospirillum doebereinerae]
MPIEFRPASDFTEQHGLFVALVGGTNSGKSFSALRLARGIAGPGGKIAAVDTEGGRLLHLKEHFDFDLLRMDPPHRPERYAEAARVAEDRGYAALLIDSFASEWRGVGGVLDWMDSELDAMVERQRANADSKGWNFDESRTRNSNKAAASIRPKMAHKLMVNSFLDRRIPIIFSIRGEMTFDPDTKKEKFKAQCGSGFLFEVTVSFRLASDRKGIIDLSDPTSYKMEGVHQEIFRHGAQLSEEHGAALVRWARGESVGGPDLSALAVEAEQAVDQGTAAYEAFWLRLPKEQKRALLPDHEDRKRRAAMASMPPVSNDDGFPADRPATREG